MSEFSSIDTLSYHTLSYLILPYLILPYLTIPYAITGNNPLQELFDYGSGYGRGMRWTSQLPHELTSAGLCCERWGI